MGVIISCEGTPNGNIYEGGFEVYDLNSFARFWICGSISMISLGGLTLLEKTAILIGQLTHRMTILLEILPLRMCKMPVPMPNSQISRRSCKRLHPDTPAVDAQ